jgi:hypothetical protein
LVEAPAEAEVGKKSWIGKLTDAAWHTSLRA